MNRQMQAEDGGGSSARDRAATALGAVLVLLFCTAFPADAGALQFNATVRGKVTDVDGNPLEGVMVTITPRFQSPDSVKPPLVVESSADGQFYARNVRIGDTSIIFELEGYSSVQVMRQLQRGPVRIDMTMEVPDVVLRADIANDAYRAGQEALNAGNYGDVVAQMQVAAEAMEDIPENAEVLGYFHALMGQGYLQQRMFQEAADAYRRWAEYHPGQAVPLLELAQVMSEMGDQEAAAGYFEAALALEPGDAMTRYNMGVIMINAGNLEDAIGQFEEAVELQPEYPLAYQQLGYAYARTEEYAKAIDAFEKYIEQSPDADDLGQIRDFVVALKDIIGDATR